VAEGEYPIFLSPIALADLEEVNAWLLEHKPELARHWRTDIHRGLARLGTFPARCPRVDELCTASLTVRQLVLGQDTILFEIAQDRVIVLRILREGREQTLG
jgi:plasmid stabilization system protein ParE